MLLSRLNLTCLFSKVSKRIPKSNLQQNVFQSFSSQMKKKNVVNEYEKKIEKDSILKKFRRDVFKKEQISQEVKAYQQEQQKQAYILKDLLNNGSKEDVIKYSKKIMDKIMNQKKLFKQNTMNPVFSDYGDYSSYRNNYATIQDRNLQDMQRIDRNHSHENLYKFLDDLPEDFEEKQNIRQQIRADPQFIGQDISIAQYGKVIQQKINFDQYISQKRIQDYETYKEGQQRIHQSLKDYWEQMQANLGHPSDTINNNQYNAGRLSPQAVDTIYECYLQGWTVRDLSRRFGISPKRTKFFIFTRAQLYDEFLPKYGWKFYYIGMQAQQKLGQEVGYVDYGLDLATMKIQRLPDTVIEWNSKRIDAQRNQQQYTEALHKLNQYKKFTRHEKVEVGTHGKQNKMYLLKEWAIFRGKGSDYYHLRNKTFRNLSKAQIKMVRSYY